MMSRVLAVALAMVVLVALVAGHPVHDDTSSYDNSVAATGHHHHPRVQIKVYRGPSHGHGWDSFAPWGYWMKQPDDDHGYHE